MRRAVARYPAIYCAVARLKPGRNRHVVDRSVDLVIEGYPRSGNTYAVAWLSLAAPAARVASHVHHTAHVERALDLGVPALVLIRHPEAAVLSHLVFSGTADPVPALRRWLDFYTSPCLRSPGVVIKTFDEVTQHMRAVAHELQARVPSLALERDPKDDEVFREVRALGARRYGSVPDAKVSVPSETRSWCKHQLASTLQVPGAAALLREAASTYEALA